MIKLLPLLSLQMTKNGSNFNLTKRFVMLLNIFLKSFSLDLVGTKFRRQIVGIPKGTKGATLIADLYIFFYERDFIMSLSSNTLADVIEAFNSTSRYLDDLLNIYNPYSEGMVSQIYAAELQLNKANTSDTKTSFLDLH